MTVQRTMNARKVVVTGGASGIGAACTALLRAQGAAVSVLDLAPPAGDPAEGVHHFAVDITRSDDVADAVAAAAAAMGGIDGLVNAAGIVQTASIMDERAPSTWERQLQVNLTGTFNVCRSATPYLMAGERGSIVNIASGQALRPMPNSAGYASSKAGVVALTRVLAQELAPKVRVNSVCPGLVKTPMLASLDPVVLAKLEASYALRRAARPEEIAQVVLFLLSDMASIVTGSTLAADGGRTFY